LEIISTIVDLFYFACLRAHIEGDPIVYRGIGNFPSGAPSFPTRMRLLAEYDAEIEVIQFHNPLEVGAFFRNVSERTANWVLERTLFYREERERRQLQNEISRQRLIDMKLKNAEKAVSLRKKLIKGGLPADEAAELLGNLISDQQARIRVDGAR
jgi:hypothetical protein